MESQYLIPYIVSQVAAVILLLAAWRLPRLGRFLFALLFSWAAWKNSITALTIPEAYLDSARLAIPLYARLINGWFSHHITEMVVIIAACQAMIAGGMLFKGIWVKAASLGAMVFLLAICPLGVGSGFPSCLIAAFAAFLIYKKAPHGYLWTAVQKASPRTA